MKRQIETVEMWFRRRILRISWTDRVSNEDVLERERCIETVDDSYREKTDAVSGTYNEM